MLDKHAADARPVVRLQKMAPTLNVWESMNLDEKLTGKAAALRKVTAKMMDENIQELNKHVDETNFPFFLVEKSKDIGVAGLMIKGYGSPGLNNLDSASIYYEMAKRDGSFALFFLAHTSLGMAVINALADEE
jgi:glutaryl-CoA dehydrogenase